MCNPALLAVAQFGSNVYASHQQQKAAKQQVAWSNRQAQAEYQTALANRQLLLDQRSAQMAHNAEAVGAEKVRLSREILGIQTGYGLRQDERSRETGQTRLEAYQQQSSFQTGAGAAGVAGNSVDRMLRGFNIAASRRVGAIEEEQRKDLMTTRMRADDAKIGSLQRQIGLDQPIGLPPMISPPAMREGPGSGSMWLGVAQAGMTGLGLYMDAGGTFGKTPGGGLQTTEPNVGLAQV